MDLATIAAWVGAVVTIATFVGAGLRFLWISGGSDLVNAARSLSEVAELVDTVRRIERRLAYQESLARAQMNDLEHALVETNSQGRLTNMNRTYLRWTGRSPDELIGEGWKNVIHPDDLPNVARSWEAAVQGERDVELTFRLVELGAPGARISSHPVRAHCYRISNDRETLGWLCNIYRLQLTENRRMEL